MARSFVPISTAQAELLKVIAQGSIDIIGEIVGQTENAQTSEDTSGWLYMKTHTGKPCWNSGWPPFMVPLYEVQSGYPGPQGLTDISLWFDECRMLASVEFIFINCPVVIPYYEITLWLRDRRGSGPQAP